MVARLRLPDGRSLWSKQWAFQVLPWFQLVDGDTWPACRSWTRNAWRQAWHAWSFVAYWLVAGSRCNNLFLFLIVDFNRNKIAGSVLMRALVLVQTLRAILSWGERHSLSLVEGEKA